MTSNLRARMSPLPQGMCSGHRFAGVGTTDRVGNGKPESGWGEYMDGPVAVPEKVQTDGLRISATTGHLTRTPALTLE